MNNTPVLASNTPVMPHDLITGIRYVEGAGAGAAPAPAAPAAPAPAAPATPPAAAPAAPEGDAKPAGEAAPALDAAKLQAELDAKNAKIDKLLAENAERRVATKEQKEQQDKITKVLEVLGINTAPDPEAAAQQIAAAQSAATEAARELAVYKAAAAAGVKAEALLDSRSFIASISSVEPGDTTAIVEAITKAAESRPDFKIAPDSQAAPGSTPTGTPSGVNGTTLNSSNAQPATLQGALDNLYSN